MAAQYRDTTRSYVWASGQVVTVGAASASSSAVASTEVLLSSTTNCWVIVGATATKTAGSLYLSAGVPFHLQVSPGAVISVLQDSAAGTLCILPVA